MIRRSRSILAICLCALALACGPAIQLEDEGSGDSTSAGEEDGDGETSGPPPNSTDGDDGGSNDTTEPDEGGEVDSGGPGCTFTCPDPPPPPPGATTGGGDPSMECSLLDQDCPEGEKCMPWANDGGPLWTATRCSPVDNRPAQYGEPCIVDGSGVSGLDTCALGLMCFDVDPMTNEGECAALCSGAEGDPVDTLLCDDPNLSCIVINDVLPLCGMDCDPVAPACDAGEACHISGDSFTCGDIPDSAAAEGEPCVGVNGCDADLMCAYGPAFECGAEPGQGCCARTCDATSPAPCMGGADCIPWFPDPAPEGYGHVGVCAF